MYFKILGAFSATIKGFLNIRLTIGKNVALGHEGLFEQACVISPFLFLIGWIRIYGICLSL